MIPDIFPVAPFPYLGYGCLVVENIASKGVVQHSLDPGGAVVLDEVIFVVAVLGQGILGQEGMDHLYLIPIQVQFLFHNSPVLAQGIVLQFLREFHYTQEVIQLSLDKFGDKVRVSEVEGAEVVEDVDIIVPVHIAEGSMAKG